MGHREPPCDPQYSRSPDCRGHIARVYTHAKRLPPPAASFNAVSWELQATALLRNLDARLNYCDMRHGDRSVHPFKAAVAHPVDLSIWQRLQALGTFRVSVVVGVMKRNVWLRTFTSAMVTSIFGMWQAIHSLPVLPVL